VIDRLITFSGDIDLIPKINLWSRVGNKMYILLEQKQNIINFDDFFDSIHNINWKKYIKKDYRIVVKSSSIRSDLFAARTMQSL
jgi:23S rRNA G2445 N2-methylase RlmL